MADKPQKLNDKPSVHFSKAGSPYVSLKEILRSHAGRDQIKKLRKLGLTKRTA